MVFETNVTVQVSTMGGEGVIFYCGAIPDPSVMNNKFVISGLAQQPVAMSQYSKLAYTGNK